MSNVGDSFPEFMGESHEGNQVKLQEYQGSDNLVVFFYPKAMTPGCVRETTEFGSRRGEFDALNTKIVGISIDPVSAQKTHADHCGATFPILSDEGGMLIEQLGIKRDSGSAMRTTYILGADGMVKGRWVGAAPEDNLESWVQGLIAGSVPEERTDSETPSGFFPLK